jgi:hypothetical protein
MDNKDWSVILAAWSRWVAGEGPPIEYFEGCGRRWLQWTDKESISKCAGLNWRVKKDISVVRFTYSPDGGNYGVDLCFREPDEPLPELRDGSVLFGPELVVQTDYSAAVRLMKTENHNMVRLISGGGRISYQTWYKGAPAPSIPSGCTALSAWIHAPSAG